MLNGAELVKPGEERWDAARGAWTWPLINHRRW
jgi:hypothetical protein